MATREESDARKRRDGVRGAVPRKVPFETPNAQNIGEHIPGPGLPPLLSLEALCPEAWHRAETKGHVLATFKAGDLVFRSSVDPEALYGVVEWAYRVAGAKAPVTPTITPETSIGVVVNAMEDENPDQRRISEIGLDVLATLLRKNRDYGSAAWKSPFLAPDMDSGSAILVRLSDKFERLRSLASRDPQVTSESFRDTMMDIVGYAILYLSKPSNPGGAV